MFTNILGKFFLLEVADRHSSLNLTRKLFVDSLSSFMFSSFSWDYLFCVSPGCTMLITGTVSTFFKARSAFYFVLSSKSILPHKDSLVLSSLGKTNFSLLFLLFFPKFTPDRLLDENFSPLLLFFSRATNKFYFSLPMIFLKNFCSSFN